VIEGRPFDSDYTIGETKALIAPLLGTTPDHMKGYIVMWVGEDDDGTPTLGMISNDEHQACRIGFLAKAIELIAHEAAHGGGHDA
jgi:hypothetical protein